MNKKNTKEKRCGWGGLATLIISIVLISYFAAQAISRTNGFRKMVEERLERVFACSVEAGDLELSPQLNLIMHDISVQPHEGQASLRAPKIEIVFSFKRLFLRRANPIKRIEVRSLHADLTRRSDNSWAPNCVSALAEQVAHTLGIPLRIANTTNRTPNSAQFPTLKMLEETQISVIGGTVVWYDSRGTELAALDNISALRVVPVQLPEEVAISLRLRVDRMQTYAGERVQNFELGVIWYSERPFIIHSSKNGQLSIPNLKQKPKLSEIVRREIESEDSSKAVQ